MTWSKIISVIAVLALVVLFNLSYFKPEKEPKNQVLNSSFDRQSENIRHENLDLLAIKHDLEISLIISLFKDYNYLTGIDGPFLPGENQNQSQIIDVPTAISELSAKYQLPQEKIAILIMDEKKLREIDSHIDEIPPNEFFEDDSFQNYR